MTPTHDLRLAGPRRDLERTRDLADHFDQLLQALPASLPEQRLHLKAKFIVDLYQGVEAVLDGVRSQLREPALPPDSWHTTLLDRAAAATGLRPAILSDDDRAALRDVMAFRHVMRHHYDRKLREQDLERLWSQVVGCVRALATSLDALDAALQRPVGGPTAVAPDRLP